MVKDLKFCNFDVLRSDFDSKDGEIIVPTNLFQNTDGSFGPGLSANGGIGLPDGYVPLAVHDVGSQKNIVMKLTATETATPILWTELKCGINSADASCKIKQTDLKLIGTVEDVGCVEMRGNILVISTPDGLRYLVWSGKDYDCLDIAAAFPTVEFGLRKAGTLTCAETFVITGMPANAGNTGGAGSGAYRPHPSAETEREDYSATFKGIAKAYTDAVDEQIVSKGYFHQPFFVRYAVRMTDGTHILPSAPILMLPTVLPPCLGLNTSTDPEGRCTITTEFSGVRYFELVYRMKKAMPPAVRTLVAAIDIFVSPKIATYDEGRLNDGFISTYAKAMGARTTMTNRGKRSAGRTAETIFEGQYSDGNDNFTSHYISQETLSKTAFMVHPNLDFQLEISKAGNFYKIATIPCTATEGFEKVETDTANFSKIEKCERLRDLSMSHFRIKATAMLVHDDSLMVATDGMILPPPFPLEATANTYHNDNSTTDTSVTMTVYTNIGGEIRRTSSQCHIPTNLAEAMPRYLFYPDRRAFLMTISDAESTYALPLQPHDKLNGAFWTGGTATDYLPDTMAEADLPEINSDSRPIDTKSTLLISDKGNILAFDSENSSTFTQSTITALCNATKPPESGTFGRHNLYAFTSEGIRMLEYSGGKVKSTHKISSLRCIGNDSIADTGESTYFVSSGQIYHLSGSEIYAVSDAVDSLSPTLRLLPHWKHLLEAAEMTMEEYAREDFFAECRLMYSAEMDALIAFRPDKDHSLVYRPGNKSWMISDITFSGKIKTTAGDLATGTCRNKVSKIVRIERSIRGINTFLITRPIKLGSPISTHCIRSIEILGYFKYGEVGMAAYGSDDLRQWHLIGSSECHHLENFSSTGYRMIRICVAAKLSEGEYLYGVRINADD